MKSIGEVIKEARMRKKISLANLEKITKIKKEFIRDIENEDWKLLPEYPVVSGFIKNITEALRINTRHAIALLRRDYPPVNLNINPKPDVGKEFSWSPKLTFVLGIVTTSLVILAYLLYQYISFVSPPNLVVDFPQESQIVKESVLDVSGKTDPEATIRVNNQPILIDEEGYFSTKIEIYEGTNEIIIVAKSRSGKETVITRKIEPELNK